MHPSPKKFKPCSNPHCKDEAKPDFPFCVNCQWMMPDPERMDMHRAQKYRNEVGRFPKDYIRRLGKAIKALNRELKI